MVFRRLLAISLAIKYAYAGVLECSPGKYLTSIGSSVDGTRPFCKGDCDSCTMQNS